MVDHGGSRCAFSNDKWLRDGFQLFQNESVDLSRDFWIGEPLVIGSELCFPNQAPAFWSREDKVLSCLLFQEGRPEGHVERPRNLKVTTISTLMTEVIKGHANLSHLAIQGNYREVTAQNVNKVYPRNLAHRQISASRFAQKAVRVNRGAESIVEGPSGI